MGMGISLADLITAQYREVGATHYMPGTQGFTMSVFNGTLVPDGTVVYMCVGNKFAEVGTAGSLPGSENGFTAACFKTADVPFATRLFINVT